MSVEITIRPHVCGGCPHCEAAAPEVFRVRGVVTIARRFALSATRGRVPLDMADAVIRAFKACPRGGISVRVVPPWLVK